MRKIARLLSYLFVVSGLQSANAATVSIDTIPGGGVDSAFAAEISDVFTVNILVGSAVDLGGHDITLAFDDSILSAISVTTALFYGATPTCTFGAPGTCTLASTIGPGGTLHQADVATGIAGITGSGTLFSVSFEAIGIGVSGLTLGSIDLSDAVGSIITPTGVFDGSVTVSAVSAVPLPGAAWLFVAGLAGIAGIGRDRSKKIA